MRSPTSEALCVRYGNTGKDHRFSSAFILMARHNGHNSADMSLSFGIRRNKHSLLPWSLKERQIYPTVTKYFPMFDIMFLIPSHVLKRRGSKICSNSSAGGTLF